MEEDQKPTTETVDNTKVTDSNKDSEEKDKEMNDNQEKDFDKEEKVQNEMTAMKDSSSATDENEGKENVKEVVCSTVKSESYSGESTDDLHSLKHQYRTEPVEGVYRDTDVIVDPAMVQSLTNGFVTRFVPSLEKARTTVDQINSSQLVLLESVQQEITKFTDYQAISELEEMMQKTKLYHNKLLKLRRDMTHLHDKSKKLKKRSLKLQQQKQKEELTKAHNQEKEFEKERKLTARVATTPD